jgi:hypothetical protein
LDYVDLSEKNFNTFSIKFIRLLLSIGSEVDVALKLLCETLNKRPAKSKIDDYRNIILSKERGFPTIEIEVRNFQKIKPWESWSNNQNPDWWHAYNDVKHERDKNFEKGNLKNVIYSLGGLYAVLLYLSKYKVLSLPPSGLFNYPGAYPVSLIFTQEASLKLP